MRAICYIEVDSESDEFDLETAIEEFDTEYGNLDLSIEDEFGNEYTVEVRGITYMMSQQEFEALKVRAELHGIEQASE